MNKKIVPTFLMGPDGRPSHAILTFEDWERLSAPPVRVERARPMTLGNPDGASARNPIRKRRLGARIRQEDLASALGVSQPALSMMEREGHQPRPANVERALAAIEALMA